MSEIEIKDLSKASIEEPFFARYLEGQLSDREQKTVVGGAATNKLLDAGYTKKYPSDRDEFFTDKYPSDKDDQGPYW